MASTLGRNAWTVQESVNMDAFSDYNYEQLDMSGDLGGGESGAVEHTLTYATSVLPAKKLVIYDTNGSMDADDSIVIKLNGETSSNKQITIDGGRNLPFTISGILLSSVVISLVSGGTTASDTLDILTFH